MQAPLVSLRRWAKSGIWAASLALVFLPRSQALTVGGFTFRILAAHTPDPKNRLKTLRIARRFMVFWGFG